MTTITADPPAQAPVPASAKPRRRAKKPACADCFFRRNMLCALQLDEACATFRPDRPEGLTPPRQLALVFREERRPQRLTGFSAFPG